MTGTDTSESRTGDSTIRAPSPMTMQSVGDAQIVLNYIAASDLKIDEKIINCIVRSKHLLDDCKWTDAAEIDFWEAFSELNRSIQPASIESLKAILPKSQTTRSKPTLRLPGGVHLTEIVFRYVLLIVLITVLVLQGYWLFGAGVVKQIKSLQAEEEKLRVSEQTTREPTPGSRGNQMLEKADVEVKSDARKDQVVVRERTDGNIQSENRINEIEKRILASFNALTFWMFYLPADTFIGKNVVLNEQLEQEKINRLAREITRERSIRRMSTGEASSEESEKINSKRRLQQSLQQKLNREKKEYARILMIIPAQFILQVLVSYILPLVYGILGATTYILRTLSYEIRTKTFKGESFIKYWLRLALGALGGLSIGWFLIPEGTFGIGSIPPLAISFLVGYNIELLFSVMDRFIAAMTEKKEPIKEETA